MSAEALQHEALMLSPGDLARWLQDHLGQKVAAFTVGLADPKMIGRYAAGKNRPRDAVLWRMQHAYQAGRLLVDEYGDVTAKSWFFGANGLLADRAPALVLREAAGPEDFGAVVRAARTFVAGGFS